MYIHQKRHTNIVLYVKRDVCVHIYRLKTFFFWYIYVWLDTMFVILFRCLHVSFVCLIWRVYVLFDTMFVFLFWCIQHLFWLLMSTRLFWHIPTATCVWCMHAWYCFYVSFDVYTSRLTWCLYVSFDVYMSLLTFDVYTSLLTHTSSRMRDACMHDIAKFCVCLFLSVYVSSDMVLVCLFWCLHISFDFWCLHVSFDTHLQPHACDACMHAIAPFFVRLFWRVYILSDTVFVRLFWCLYVSFDTYPQPHDIAPFSACLFWCIPVSCMSLLMYIRLF